MPVLLVSEQRSEVRGRLLEIFGALGYPTAQADDRAAVFRYIEHTKPLLAILGHTGTSPDDPIGLARVVRARHPELPVILFVLYSSEELAIAAIKAGVQDYVR